MLTEVAARNSLMREWRAPPLARITTLRIITTKPTGTRIAIAAATAGVLLVLVFSMIPPSAASPSLATFGARFPAVVAAPPVATVPVSGLQAEVDRTPSGGTIHLGAGTFVGQLRIYKDVDLVGAGEGKTILLSPANMTIDPLGNVFVVEVVNHAIVRISDLTVRVTEQCMLANSIGVATGGGIGVGGDSTLQVWNVGVWAYGPSPNLDQSCTTHGSAGMLSFGRAISIGLDDGPGVGSNFQVEGHGSIEHVNVHGFDIFSISVGRVRGPSGSTATITNNVVVVGPGPYTAAYGIVAYGVSTISDNQVTGVPGSDGGIAVVFTSAVVTNNVITDFTCTNAPFPIAPPCGVDPFYDDQDLGIFLAGITPGTIVTGNAIGSVDSGILVDGPGAPAKITYNVISSSTYYGLELINANQTFRDDAVLGGLYAIAVGAENANTTARLVHDTLSGLSVGVALLEANSPWVAKAVVT
jgi:hypothetical protein